MKSLCRVACALIGLLAITGTPAFSQGKPRIDTQSLPEGRVGVLYQATLAARGGDLPYSWQVSSGSLPPGLVLSRSTGTIAGTPLTADRYTFAVLLTDSSGQTDSQAFAIVINPVLPPTIQTSSLPAGTVGATYSATLSASGGAPPYTWSISAGSLPGGLSLNSSSGALNGTPTAAGTFNFTTKVTDVANQSATKPLSIAVSPAPPPPLSITTGALPAGTAGQAYNQSLAASGGTPPYSWTVSAGALPAGLSLSTGGAITGTPGGAGTSSFTVRAADSASQSTTKVLSITINAAPPPPITITTEALPAGTAGQAYSQSLAASGGTPPYSWTVSAGALPAGLGLSASGAITGTPSAAGTSSFTVRAADSASQSTTKVLSITINAAPPPPITITTEALPAGTAGQAYSQSLAASGGTPPYSWTVSAGALPAGLSLSAAGAITGTPSAAGTSNFTVRAADSGSQSATKALSITINAAPPPPLSITTGALPSGTAGQAYSQTLEATGGTPPYSWTVSAGTLPAGLSLSASGEISGMPSAAGTSNFTARAADSAGQSATKALSITINAAPPPPVNIATDALAAGTQGEAYNQSLAATGGTPPYSWTVSAGTLPAGLSLSASGAITGTPSAPGTSNFTMRAADSAGQSATKALSITINAAPPPPVNITTDALAGGTQGEAYSQTLAAGGGTPPYNWTVSAGTLPAGLSLSASGAITGTPSAAGTSTFTVRAADSAGQSATKPLSITINAAPTPPTITTTTSPTGVVGQPYTASLTASGGAAPYTWSATAGTFPPGLGLSPSGAISGTPTTAGDFDFTARVTDAASRSATKQLRITISPALVPPAISTSSLPEGSVGAQYAQVLAATGGRSPYQWSIASGTLPSGVTLEGTAGRLAGTPAAAGAFPFTVRVTDADSRTAERAFTLTVAPALAISACPANTGIIGTTYSATLTASGGSTPYLWSVVSGQMPPGVTLLTSGGVLRGNPLLAGTFQFTLNVSDGASRSATRSCTITIASQLQVVTDSAPDATTRSPYSLTLQTTGGTSPYRWSTISGSLPPGLTLNENLGTITGQPSQPGRFSFTVQVNDAAGAQAQRALTIGVVAGLGISSCPTAAAMVTQPYTSTLSSIGGQAPYNWSIAAGSLPAGLTLRADSGVLSGTPSAAGAAEFSIQVTDASNTTVARSCSIQVAPELMITTSALSGTEVGQPYTASLQASGGIPPYNWTISAGALAPGLTLNSATGQITGTASASATFRFTARVIDSAGAQREKPLEIGVGTGFAIAACPSAAAIVGEAYSSSLSTSGGEAPITWVLDSGALPAGLTLNAQTGTVTGIATSPSTSDFVVRASDAKSKAATRACSIAVTPSALRISGPDSLPDGVLGTAYQQDLQASGGRGPYAWSVSQGALPAGLTLAANGRIEGNSSTAGTFRFTVRAGDADGGAATRAFELRVLPAKAPAVSFGELPDIVPPAQQPRVRVALESAYPVPLHGKLMLRFIPDPTVNVDDPSVRFITGDRSVDFDVPANSTETVFAVPQMALQTGSVAGTIELSATLTAGDLDVTPSPVPLKNLRIDRTAPVITNVRVNRTSSGFELAITGFSTTREVTSATFQFTPAAGSRLDSTQITVQTGEAARLWFTDSRSADYGGQFTFVQPFTLQNATLSEVSVTLTNGQGTSQPVRAAF